MRGWGRKFKSSRIAWNMGGNCLKNVRTYFFLQDFLLCTADPDNQQKPKNSVSWTSSLKLSDSASTSTHGLSLPPAQWPHQICQALTQRSLLFSLHPWNKSKLLAMPSVTCTSPSSWKLLQPTCFFSVLKSSSFIFFLTSSHLLFPGISSWFPHFCQSSACISSKTFLFLFS